MKKVKKVNILKKYRILEIFEGEDGRFSLTKVGLLLILTPVSILWTLTTISKHELQDIPSGLYILIGLLASARIGQTIIDKKMGK
jgi:hypothetical protein